MVRTNIVSCFRMRFIATLCFLSFLFCSTPALYADDTSKNAERAPVPYSENEFPLWATELRRFEILTLGALPLVTMLSFWTYDIARSLKHTGDERYYPWPLKKSEIAIPISSSTQRKIFFTALGISLGIALTDICVRAIIRRIREKKEAEQNILYDDAIRLEAIE